MNVASVASLPMYDLPELRKETDSWWTHLASHMRRAGVKDVPSELCRVDRYESIWSHPALLISQTCGYPLVTRYRHLLRPLATLRYGVEGCRGADYTSVVVVAANCGISAMAELRDKVCAVNSTHSHSGYNAIRAVIAPLSREGRFFSRVKTTGSHRESIRAVVAGEADVCSVDCITYALLARYAPETTAGTRALGFTDRCPGLPLVARRGLDSGQRERLRAALRSAIIDPAGEMVRSALFIQGMSDTVMDDYHPILAMERRAREFGYGELR